MVPVDEIHFADAMVADVADQQPARQVDRDAVRLAKLRPAAGPPSPENPARRCRRASRLRRSWPRPFGRRGCRVRRCRGGRPGRTGFRAACSATPRSRGLRRRRRPAGRCPRRRGCGVSHIEPSDPLIVEIAEVQPPSGPMITPRDCSPAYPKGRARRCRSALRRRAAASARAGRNGRRTPARTSRRRDRPAESCPLMRWSWCRRRNAGGPGWRRVVSTFGDEHCEGGRGCLDAGVNRCGTSCGAPQGLLRCVVLLAGVGAAACGGRRSPAAPTGPPSGPAGAYLDELIGLMQAHSINRLTIDWSAFRTSVFARAAGAQSIAGTYPAIQVALDALGDGHSQYLRVHGDRPWSREARGLWPVPARARRRCPRTSDTSGCPHSAGPPKRRRRSPSSSSAPSCPPTRPT